MLTQSAQLITMMQRPTGQSRARKKYPKSKILVHNIVVYVILSMSHDSFAGNAMLVSSARRYHPPIVLAFQAVLNRVFEFHSCFRLDQFRLHTFFVSIFWRGHMFQCCLCILKLAEKPDWKESLCVAIGLHIILQSYNVQSNTHISRVPHSSRYEQEWGKGDSGEHVATSSKYNS